MNGGMIRAAGHGAIAVLAGVLLSAGSAQAADLGGNCCVDLEERVAELEATTARKGNRKVSLTIYGWVNKAVLYWNDGNRDNTYFGVDNTNFATRFGFRGEAKINPTVKAGFSILIDVISGARTSVDQPEPRGCVASCGGRTQAVRPPAASTTFLDDHAMRMRDANVWIEHNAPWPPDCRPSDEPGPPGHHRPRRRRCGVRRFHLTLGRRLLVCTTALLAR